MRAEELFAAIGEVEESRLARSELTAHSSSGDTPLEESNMKKQKGRSGRVIRNLLIAAVLVSMLAVTAFAAMGLLLYDSPAQMLSSIFGDDTGFDHSDGSITVDPWGGPDAIIVEPTFDRVSPDETVVEKDVAPFVSPVGQSISMNGYTLTVDSFLYDSNTKCGFVTYLLENSAGVNGYNLQQDGEIWYDGKPDIVQINQYGKPYIIQEKTTDTCLAATYYFLWDADRGDTLDISLSFVPRYTPEEFEAMLDDDIVRIKAEITPQEAVECIKQQVGEETFWIIMEDLTEEEIIEQCYTQIAADQVSQRIEEENNSEFIRVPCHVDHALDCVTLGNGSVTITPISFHIDITNLEFLHTDKLGALRIHTDNVDSVIIRYNDGTEYILFDGYIINYVFALSQSPEENVAEEVYITPEEDPAGEGYFMVINSHDYSLLTTMFNRIIDINKVESVIINGTELPVD